MKSYQPEYQIDNILIVLFSYTVKTDLKVNIVIQCIIHHLYCDIWKTKDLCIINCPFPQPSNCLGTLVEDLMEDSSKDNICLEEKMFGIRQVVLPLMSTWGSHCGDMRFSTRFLKTPQDFPGVTYQIIYSHLCNGYVLCTLVPLNVFIYTQAWATKFRVILIEV